MSKTITIIRTTTTPRPKYDQILTLEAS